MKDLNYWIKLYDKNKFQSLCIDLEFYKGKITMVGAYRPKDGDIDCITLIKDQNLTRENLVELFKGCKMLITFNGKALDIPKLNKEFPGVLPKVPEIDIYIWAKHLNLDTNLKVLESTLDISRLLDATQKRRIASKLWDKWIRFQDQKSLDMLIEYNKQDTVNLYPIAEKLIKIAKNE